VIRRFNKAKFPPKGLAGGRDGSAARFVVNPGTRSERDYTASARLEMHAGERFLLQSAGGGGFGEPAARDKASVARDVAEGYVTPSGAQRDFGK
jgi:N-methylhydantoinase B